MANELNSPMNTPWTETSRGGNHPGMKDDVAVGGRSGSGEVNSPMRKTFGKIGTTPSTAGGPAGLQVTESLHDVESRKNRFPTGTGTPVSGE